MTIYAGDFEKREQIGKGGMAWVFKGWQLSLNRPVAIKIMYPQLAEDERLRKRFLQEGFNAANMDHENIVHVYRAGDETGQPYIAMEFIDGLDLLRWRERRGQLPIEIAMITFRDICRGLEHAHERNVIHRDLKPSNVMLSRDGMVKLMDFGLARRLDFETSLTTPGMVLGTIPYMAPELATRRDATAASDIFSLGIVGYELLGGERPFKGETPSEISRQIQTSDPPTLDTLNPLVPEAMTRTIQQMLIKDPERRIRSVTEVLQQVEEGIDALDIRRERALLRDYAREPDQVAARLRKERLSRCLNQALFLESQGMNRIDEAIRAFGQVLALEPTNELASKRYKALMRERSERGGRDLVTLILPSRRTPGAKPAAGQAPSPKSSRRQAVGRRLTIAVGIGVVLVAGWRGWPAASRLLKGPPSGVQPGVPAPTPLPPVSRVSVDTSPAGGMVVLGSGRPERAPVRFDGLPPGDYPFTATLVGYLPHRGTLTLAAGRDTSILLSLDREAPTPAPPAIHPTLRKVAQPPPPAGFGTLVISASPAPQYVVDGEPKSSGILEYTLKLPEGIHRVRLDHPSYDIKEFPSVRVVRDSTVHLTWNFEESSHSRIKIMTSGRYWGRIVLDDKDLGDKAPKVIPVRSGYHRIRLYHDGYNIDPPEREVVVDPGEEASLLFTITPRE